MIVDPLPAALHIQSIQRQHSEAKPNLPPRLTSGRAQTHSTALQSVRKKLPEGPKLMPELHLATEFLSTE